MVFIIFGFFVVSWQYLTWVGSPLPSLLLGAGVTCAAEGGSRQTAGCGSLISTPGNFIGVKGGEKHCEATEPRAGVDYLSGLGVPEQGWYAADGVLPVAAVGFWWPVVG